MNALVGGRKVDGRLLERAQAVRLVRCEALEQLVVLEQRFAVPARDGRDDSVAARVNLREKESAQHDFCGDRKTHAVVEIAATSVVDMGQ